MTALENFNLKGTINIDLHFSQSPSDEKLGTKTNDLTDSRPLNHLSLKQELYAFKELSLKEKIGHTLKVIERKLRKCPPAW